MLWNEGKIVILQLNLAGWYKSYTMFMRMIWSGVQDTWNFAKNTQLQIKECICIIYFNVHWEAVIIVQWKFSITRSLGPRIFVCYIRYFVISVVNKQYKTKEINSLGPEKLVCYIRYFVISDLFRSSFHCTTGLGYKAQEHRPKIVLIRKLCLLNSRSRFYNGYEMGWRLALPTNGHIDMWYIYWLELKNPWWIGC